MKKEYLVRYVPLNRDYQSGDIVYDIEQKRYCLIQNGKDLDKAILYAISIVQLLIIKKNTRLNDWKHNANERKKIICAYPRIEEIPSLTINFIKKYVEAGCPEKIYLECEYEETEYAGCNYPHPYTSRIDENTNCSAHLMETIVEPIFPDDEWISENDSLKRPL